MSLEHGALDPPPAPVSQLLRTAVPLGLLWTAAVADLIDLATGTGAFNLAAYWLIAAGVASGAVALPWCWLDRLQLPPDEPARRAAGRQGAGLLMTITLFAASWALRVREVDVPALALGLSLAGAGAGLATFWFGGAAGDGPGR